ncbi:MAG: rRNA maturation RNase YbeY [Spirochaetaceae bacterium]|jgi:probable rRNA maturation factor|nr:rRNA maturation RNase YbeY [Spirochaetaceae bacterium]
MNRAEIRAEEVPLPPWAGSLSEYSVKALGVLGRDGWDLSILLCNDAYIRRLNARYRGRDEPTDVLSFSLGETCPDGEGGERYLPGDIVISLETLEENSRFFEVSFDEELRRVIIHGMLHLSGMDHETNGKDEPMLLLQEQILEKTEGRILPPNSCRACVQSPAGGGIL